jgi:predicted alpha/beta superfamily hydrolase
LNILGWEDLGGSNPSTATASVSIITDSFYMPEFNRYRRIWVYLPPDYTENPDKRYHVLYMHDGQNLFDLNTSFAGEWRVDESLDSLQKAGFDVGIVVGINNGGGHRIAEYTPWPHPTHGGGDGDKYIQFIKNTLKPYIDENYRTKPEPEHTGIMGSSLGGLISMYAGLQYPEDFTKIGAFSSSFWFSSKIYDLAADADFQDNHRYYLIAGSNEGGNQVGDMNAMVAIKTQKGYGTEQLFHEAHQGATHSEWYWAREFPKAYKFLFSSISNTDDEVKTAIDFKLMQLSGMIRLEEVNTTAGDEYSLIVTDSSGRQVMKQSFKSAIELKTNSWGTGVFIISISNAKGLVKTYRIFAGE